MDKLLGSVLGAHGGVRNWAKVKKVTANLSLGGPFWGWRGWPDVYAGQMVTLDPLLEHIEFAPFTQPDRVSILNVAPERVTIQTLEGKIVESRTNPRASFPKPFDSRSTLWDAIQIAYFTSAGIWNYLTEPFGFTYPGVEAHEIEPWTEDGQTWRRLAVRFPPSNANHSENQIFYYDERFMQRRMDYAPDVAGNAPVAHYTHDPKTFDGFVYPTRRLVHLHDAEGKADQGFAAITLNIYSVSVE
jgi:hypothetical protein